MPTELVNFITQYGYLAIFILVFLQEIGIPSLVPNELVLLFSGYLTVNGTLSLPLVFTTAILGDFLGTTLLYYVFYYFGKKILEKKPRWITIDVGKIERLGRIITEKNQWGMFLGRLIPYVRGYASVAAGIFQLKPRIFMVMVLLSAILWSGGYVFVGKLSYKSWNIVASRFSGTGTVIYIVLAVLFVLFFGIHLFKQLVKNKK
jgi:membrane protein DedA with SNARE-associated domain